MGRNGEGKSTLVKCILNEIPFTGELKIGHNVQIGYFAQNQAQLLDEELTVFETIDHVAKGDIRLKIRDILGAFMFGGEASDKKVKVLSGGERSRLAMIKLLLEPVNLLILDEPTNHLDMQSKDVLKEAIKAFDGTAIVVSHDREFLDGLVEKVYEFGEGRVKEHLGGIYDFIRSASANQVDNGSPASIDSILHASASMPTKAEETPKADNESYAQRKERMKKVSKAEKAVKECEARIASMEKRIEELNVLLSDVSNASDMTLVSEYTSVQRALDTENEKWMELSETLEQLTAQV